MGLNDDMQNLIRKIKEPSIFYLPRKLMENVAKEDFSELESIGFLNTLFLLNKEGKTKTITHSPEPIQLIEKDKILSSNIFQLLALKNKLDKEAFCYLLSNYQRDLTNWLTLLEIVKVNAENEATNYKKYMQGYLDSQFSDLKSHEQELKQKFGDWKGNFVIDEIIKDYTLTFNNNKKRLLLSTEEVDKFLLYTVFNVDITNNNK